MGALPVSTFESVSDAELIKLRRYLTVWVFLHGEEKVPVAHFSHGI
jgi:hypothetical protein